MAATEKNEKRFHLLITESLKGGFGTTTSILVDKQTGVHYLCMTGTCGEGMTPLLDQNGEVLIDHTVVERNDNAPDNI